MAILIKNGTVISSTGAIPMDVLVDGERIAALGEPGSINVSESEQTIDAAGKYVIPGGVDVHTHMELPVRRHLRLRHLRDGHAAPRPTAAPPPSSTSRCSAPASASRTAWPSGTARPTATAPSTTAST